MNDNWYEDDVIRYMNHHTYEIKRSFIRIKRARDHENITSNTCVLVIDIQQNETMPDLYEYTSVRHIIFEHHYNQCIKSHTLPKYLTHLTFGYYFNNIIECLPETLIYLTFGNNFSQNICRILPHGLLYLYLGTKFNHCVDHLPLSLKFLRFGMYSEFNRRIDHLPSGLTHLEFGLYSEFKKPICNIPSSITYLKLGEFYDII